MTYVGSSSAFIGPYLVRVSFPEVGQVSRPQVRLILENCHKNCTAEHHLLLYHLMPDVTQLVTQGKHINIILGGCNQERQQPKDGTSPCSFRIASEGLPFLLPHMSKQIVLAPKEDFRLLLANKVVPFSAFNDSSFSAALQNLKHGCCVVALPTGKSRKALCLSLSGLSFLFIG